MSTPTFFLAFRQILLCPCEWILLLFPTVCQYLALCMCDYSRASTWLLCRWHHCPWDFSGQPTEAYKSASPFSHDIELSFLSIGSPHSWWTLISCTVVFFSCTLLSGGLLVDMHKKREPKILFVTADSLNVYSVPIHRKQTTHWP